MIIYRILLFIIFYSCFLSFNFAQYQPLLGQGKSWDIYQSSYNGEIQIVPYSAGARIQQVGDTMLLGKRWHTFTKRDFQVVDQPVFYPTFSLEQEEPLNWLMREDTTHKLVYALYQNPETQTYQERLIYNFNLAVGDTMVYYHGFQVVPDSSIWTCTNISSLNLANGTTAKVYELEDDSGVTDFFGPLHITEQIGGPHLFWPSNIGWSVGCVFLENQTIYDSQSSYGCNSIISSNHSLPTFNLKVYPNPIYNELIIEGTTALNDKAKVELYNGLGQRVFQYTIYLNEMNRFSMAYLVKGIYFLRVEYGQRIYTQVIVK